MSGESTTEESVERSESDRSDNPMERDEARAVLDRQVQIMRRMNDELLRTARVHVILGGAMVTIISIVNASLFLPNSNPAVWFIGFTLSSLSFISWYNHLGASRLSYTDLSIGVHRDLDSFQIPTEGSSDTALSRLQKAARNLPTAVSTFFGNTITPEDFEDRTDRNEAVHQMLSDDYRSAVKDNIWILATREKYLNAVQGYLYGAFLLLVLGMLLMIAS